eukprot:GHVN01000303.1.p1 GENE.GHVN01000303.1~~GHVN01000303.1.p1  ORF type:complete len:133 (+),score=18.75 GHVN01000303.1:72-470(+)
MWGSFLDSVNSAVDSAGGYEKIASTGMGMAQSWLMPEGPQGAKQAARDEDEPPKVEDWGALPLNGNKKAVLIGINYKGQQGELRGCINDVVMMKQYIVEQQGFPTDEEHMLVLTEDEPTKNHPNKQRILECR